MGDEGICLGPHEASGMAAAFRTQAARACSRLIGCPATGRKYRRSTGEAVRGRAGWASAGVLHPGGNAAYCQVYQAQEVGALWVVACQRAQSGKQTHLQLG